MSVIPFLKNNLLKVKEMVITYNKPEHGMAEEVEIWLQYIISNFLILTLVMLVPSCQCRFEII